MENERVPRTLYKMRSFPEESLETTRSEVVSNTETLVDQADLAQLPTITIHETKSFDGSTFSGNTAGGQHRRPSAPKDIFDQPGVYAGTRKKSIYKPVYHRPRAATRTSFLHVFRFATPLDYVIMTLALFFSISAGLIVPAMTHLLSDLLNAFSDFQERTISKETFDDRVDRLAWEFTALGGAAFVCTCSMICLWTWTGERQTQRLRQAYFRSLLRMNIDYFERDEVTAGGLLTSINKDVDSVQMAISENLGFTITDTVTVFGCFALAFSKHAILTLVILAAIPLIVGCLALTGKFAGPSISKERSILMTASNIVETALGAIRTVKAFNGEDKEENRHRTCLEQASPVSRRLARTFAIRTGLVQFLLLAIFVQGFWFGSGLVVDRKLSPGGVLSVFYSCLSAAAVMKVLLTRMEHFSKAKAAMCPINELLEEVAHRDLEELRGFKLEKLSGHIEFEQVTFAYPSRPDTCVLCNVDLVFPAGRTTVLVGQSGSGKSTVAQLIQRLYDAEEGLVTLDGRDLKILSISWLRQQIGIVSQEPVLFDDTIFHNVAYGKTDYWNATLDEVVAACKIACIHDFIEGLPDGYQTHLGDKAKTLSGGQRQRIAIARALIKDPAILILDEASSALDTESDRLVQQALDNCRENRTTIVITHKLSQINETDLVYVLHQGNVVEKGTPPELLANEKGHYSKLVAESMTGNPKRRTKELQKVVQRLKSTLPSAPYNLTVDPTPLSDYPGTTFAGGLQRSLSVARRHNWRQSVYEDYFDPNAMDVLEKSATNAVSNRCNRASYFGLLSYYDDGEEHGAINIMISKSDQEATKDAPRLSFLQLLQLTMPAKIMWVAGLVASVINGFVLPVFSYVLSKLLVAYSLPDPEDVKSKARMYALIILVISVVNGVSAYFKYLWLERSSEKWAVQLRSLGFSRVLLQPVAWFDKQENAPGKLTSILVADTDAAKNLIGHFAGTMIFVVVTLVAGLIWAFARGWQLALVGFGTVPVVLIATELQRRTLQKYERRRKVSIDDAADVFYQTMASIRTVFSLGIGSVMQSRFDRMLKKPYGIGVRKGLVFGFFYGVLDGLQYLTKAVAFWYGGRLVARGEYDLERMLTVWTLVIFCSTSASQMLANVPYIAKSKTAVWSINRILSLPRPSTDGKRIDRFQGSVIFKNVHFAYPERPNNPILQGLTFTMQPGQTIALVGKSGNGKSTVAALVQRFYEPIRGAVLVNYENANEFDLHWLREQISVVSQEPVLFDVTIAENIAYGKDNATQAEIEKAAKLVNMHDFIASLPQGYRTKLGAGGALSGGQKQRIAIARALIREPKILILDEATSALDATNEQIVQDTLNRIQQSRACSTLVITHRLNAVRNVDRICLVERGRISEVGTHQELMENRGSYWSLVTSGEFSK